MRAPRRPPPLVIPRHLLANRSIYRTLSQDVEDSLIGAGFSLKAGGDDGRRQGLRHYGLSWCLRGSGFYDDGVTRGEVVPGTLFQRFPGTAHTLDLTKDGQWAECWLALGASSFQLLTAYRIAERRQALLHLPLDLATVIEIEQAQTALRAARERDLPLHVARILTLIIDLLLRAGAAGADRSLEIVERARRRLASEERVPLQEMARDSGMSYERFRKVFRERTGVGPGEYRILRRLDRARALLHDPARTIAGIADELGYSSAFAFSSQFKRFVGIPPNRYRRNQ